MDTSNAAGRFPWDAYQVWQILLRRHPVKIKDPSGTCGHIDRATLAEFCEGVSDFPDFLQDTLFVIGHAEGLAAAMCALDDAVREHLSNETTKPNELRNRSTRATGDSPA